MSAAIRSFLFVPGDSERKLARGAGSGADALILDLEDSVAPAHKAEARALVADYLRDHAGAGRRPRLWVRINPLDGPDALADLAAIVPAAPDGIVLPKPEGPDDVRRCSHYLDALEAAAGLPVGGIPVLPIATETPAAAFRLGDYAGAGLARLHGLSWGAEDLSAALGASTNRAADGGWSDAYRLARSLCLLGAHAAGVAAIETLHADFRDTAGLVASSRAAQAEGFSGRLAIHPDQVGPINEAFTPSADEVAFARQVVALFAANPQAGALSLEGKMLDRPHLVQAQRVLARHDAASG
jgi:citrate lyase subunit beta/citryl-CoA lyase